MFLSTMDVGRAAFLCLSFALSFVVFLAAFVSTSRNRGAPQRDVYLFSSSWSPQRAEALRRLHPLFGAWPCVSTTCCPKHDRCSRRGAGLLLMRETGVLGGGA